MINGVNPAAVQRILRHSVPKITTEVYGHLSPGHLRAVAGKLSFNPPAVDESIDVVESDEAQAVNATPFVDHLLAGHETTYTALAGKQ